ncbi:type II secretion system protein [Amylibacter sp. SFDW26]|uniref:type II secretion system protein n=1 Tax=Amylibacter sp. SFDW26 TaxID=2652722 RepID=UPI001261C6CC|nr:type II secretion system protein [Amylibacter sp. SFDW26]KAB7610190.1 type II secretion system protein [Amylibacter sp. SFDW26]
MTSRFNHKSQSGVTLLETLFALAIFILIVVIAGQSYQRYSDRNARVDINVVYIESTVQSLRLRSIAKGEQQIMFVNEVIGTDNRQCQTNQNAPIIFYANGIVSSDPICILLSDDKEKTIVIDWMTGELKY